MNKETQQLIKEGLKESTLSFTPLPEDKGLGFQIFLGCDYQEREISVLLEIKELSFQQEGGKDNSRKITQIELSTDFPFEVKDHAIFDVARALHLINSLAPFPGFILHELDQVISYRYVWVGDYNKESSFALLSIIGTFSLYHNFYTPSLEKLSLGYTSMEDVLGEFEEAAQLLLNSQA